MASLAMVTAATAATVAPRHAQRCCHRLRPPARPALAHGRTLPALAAAALAARGRRVRATAAAAGPTAAAGEGAYVDVHCHLTHESYEGSAGEDRAVGRARAAGLARVIVNGLDPESNRAVTALCARHPDVLRPALGIYPLHASTGAIDVSEFRSRLNFDPPEAIDLAAEIDHIDSQAAAGHLAAVGEAGLDGMYGYSPTLLSAQEEVLRELCRLARRRSLPIIVHSRAAEKRVFDVLVDEGVEHADFHCFMGKRKLGVEIAEAGYYLSIPSVVKRNTQLQGLVRALPLERLLTETDAPYLAPEKGAWPNEPSTVPEGVAAIAEARGEPVAEVRAQIMANYSKLFKD